MTNIVDSIFSEYGDLADTQGIQAVPEPERTLIAIYTAQGIIGNGGFSYFFESEFKGDDCYKNIIKSYINIGLNTYAEAIQNVLNLFPNGMLQSKSKERENFIYKYLSGDDEANHSKIVEKAEEIFLKDSEEVYKLAEQYVKKNV